MAAFLGPGALPCGEWTVSSRTPLKIITLVDEDVLRTMDLDATRNPRWVRGFWNEHVPGGMHYRRPLSCAARQHCLTKHLTEGRRWGGSGVYNAETTFRSYGVDFDPGLASCSHEIRDSFIAAVPQSHKDFLCRLKWIVDLPVPAEWGVAAGGRSRVLAVHAGLARRVNSEVQIAALKARDLSSSVIQKSHGRIDPFSGRAEVRGMPKDLARSAFLISGHHHFSDSRDGRVIVDRSGGEYGLPLEAYILPSGRTILSQCV